MTTSYASPYAGPTRASRVATPVRPIATLTRVAMLEAAPRFVLVDATSRHVVLDYGASYEVLSAEGARLSRGEKFERASLTLGRWGFLNGGSEVGFTGDPRPISVPTALEVSGALLALRLEGDSLTSVVYASPSLWVPKPTIVLYARTLLPPTREMSELVFSEVLEGKGVAAIRDDGRVFVAKGDRAFLALGPEAQEGTTSAVRHAEATLPFSPCAMSVVEGAVAVVGEGTELAGLDEQGQVAWSVALPFAPEMPPIDGGSGRIYVAGRDLAAIEGGRVLWATRDGGGYLATAYADGALAVVEGTVLRIALRDGAPLGAVSTPEGEAIATPPAIGADGSIWVATAQGLYVARGV